MTNKLIKKLTILATTTTLATSAMAYTIENQWYSNGQPRVDGRCANGTYFNGGQNEYSRLWTILANSQFADSPSMDQAIRKACGE